MLSGIGSGARIMAAVSFSVRSKGRSPSRQPLDVVAALRQLKTAKKDLAAGAQLGSTGEPWLWLVPVGEETCCFFLLPTPVHDPACRSGARATAKVSASKFKVGQEREALCAVSLGGNEGSKKGFIRDDWGDVSCCSGCFCLEIENMFPAC